MQFYNYCLRCRESWTTVEKTKRLSPPLALVYLIEKLRVPEVVRDRVCTFSVLSGKDLSTTRVRAKYSCRILRIEDGESIARLIVVFGISAVAGVRKKPPVLSKRVGATQPIVTTRGGLQLLDVINLIDVHVNQYIPPVEEFTLNAQGRKGIDFIYIPEQKSIRISIWYKKYVVKDAVEKIRALGVGSTQDGEPLTDKDLEAAGLK